MSPGHAKEKKILFDPPLWMQRRAAILQELRDHRCSSVLDIGCGEGNLLEYLIPYDEENIHLGYVDITRLTGVDICRDSLDQAWKACIPKPVDETRGAPLTIDLFIGDIADIANASTTPIARYDAVVLTEVIEHLHPPLIHPPYTVDEKLRLQSCIPDLIRAFRPKIVILTTPNRDFNKCFGDTGFYTVKGCPYPVRHHEHLFEFTVNEFTEWCEYQVSELDYTVTITGIGRTDLNPYGATQMAVLVSPSGEESIENFQGEEFDLREVEGLEKHSRISFPWQRYEANFQDVIHILNEIMPYLDRNVKKLETSVLYKTRGTINDIWNSSYRLRKACAGDRNVIKNAIAESTGGDGDDTNGTLRMCVENNIEAIEWIGYPPEVETLTYTENWGGSEVDFDELQEIVGSTIIEKNDDDHAANELDVSAAWTQQEWS